MGWGDVWTGALLFKCSKCLIKYHSVVVAAPPRRLQLGSTLFKSSSCLFMHFVALCILHCWTKAHQHIHIHMYACICTYTYICIVYGCSYIHSFMKVPAWPPHPLRLCSPKSWSDIFMVFVRELKYLLRLNAGIHTHTYIYANVVNVCAFVCVLAPSVHFHFLCRCE